MGNTLTDLAPDIYKAANIVGKRLKGLITSVTINGSDTERVAYGDSIRAHYTPVPTVNSTYTPAMTIPEGDDQEIGSATLTINKAANVQIPWTGEDIQHVDNGPGYQTIFGEQIEQAMEAIGNQIEADLAAAIYPAASRAVGSAGVTPFASDFKLIAQLRKILVDNGMPTDNLSSLVMNTDAGTNLRNLAQLQKVNESGGEQLLRNGVLLDLQGLMMKESAQIKKHSGGAASGDTVDGAHDEGDLVISVSDFDAGGYVAGDVVTIGNFNYVVVSADATENEITIAKPGLMEGVSNGVSVALAADYTANIGLHKGSAGLVVRPPKMPYGGDAAVDRMTIQDVYSGLVFEVASYKGYGKAMFDVTVLYGIKAWKPEFIALLLG